MTSTPDMSFGAWLGMALAGLIWGVRLEGRVNAHDQLFEERKQLANERHEDVKDRLERIEQKLDRALED